MIIILGPDHTGKTTLARALHKSYHHFTKESSYEDYVKPLVNLDLFDAVLDRHAICEYAYSKVMGRRFRYSMKEWHNIISLTLIQNPLVILCTHKPLIFEYSADQYLPYDKWDLCLELYRAFLSTHHIQYIEYDYVTPIPTSTILLIEDTHKQQIDWWLPMWREGFGCIGAPNPKVLLVAERIGPNNMNNLPFETGPTGHMLSDMLARTGTPLNKFAVTNMVKSFRRDMRPPNQADMDLLCVELVYLKPEKVVFMGTIAQQGIKVAQKLGIPYETMVHFGYYNHKKESPAPLHEQWTKIMGITG